MTEPIDDGIDAQNVGQPAGFAGSREIDLVLDDRFFDHAQRHDLEAGHRLQLGKVGQRELAAIDRRLVALIEERRDRHPAQLRERIVDDRLVADVRKDQAAAGGADQHHASQHGGEEKPEMWSAAKHRLDSERESSPPASKTSARRDTGALRLSTAGG